MMTKFMFHTYGTCDWRVNTLRPRQNGRHFTDDIFNSIFLNENVLTLIKISPKFVPKGLINNIPALVQIMAWRRPGNKPLSEPMMVSLLTHICVTRPQWVKHIQSYQEWHICYCCGDLVVLNQLVAVILESNCCRVGTMSFKYQH